MSDCKILEFPFEANARNWGLSCRCGGFEFEVYRNGDIVCTHCRIVNAAARAQEIK